MLFPGSIPQSVFPVRLQIMPGGVLDSLVGVHVFPAHVIN